MKNTIEDFRIGQTVKHNIMPFLGSGIVKEIDIKYKRIMIKWSLLGNELAHLPHLLTILAKDRNNPNDTFKGLKIEK